MENVIFFFANLPVYSYGFMLGLGLLIGSALAQREARRKGIGSDFVFRFIVKALLVFVVVGRIAHVYPLYGLRTFIYPWTLFSGMQLDESRGLLAVGVYTFYFLIRRVENPASFLDSLVPSIALIQSLGYLGSSILGRETLSRWGVDLGEFMLHPLPLYSALVYYVIFSFLWRIRRNLRYDGQLLLGYLALSALAQRFLMPYREVFGESTNPWLYTIASVIFGSAWFYFHIQTPFTDSRRRLDLSDWRSWLVYFASVLGVGFIMVQFFYWRFS
ncbi:MAG: prolipoprotein diacylglyceryl transferase [Limnochordia bacterium]|jgi:phosphatidylglycerol:prolipoprotein diacylglycerol transferase|nr:prolipoprotein diacylglyceryl transferase [Limnochordia bacterium]